VKSAVERWLLQRWYGGRSPGFGLRFLAGVHHLGLKAKGALAPRGPSDRQALSAPVIVVGNFTAGGTGKTPLVIALAEHLAERGFRPGIVSRGYGRTSTEPVRVGRETPVEQCGDEPKLMFERTGLPVLVDRDRLAAAVALISDGCGVVIADDGLQHANLSRDIEIEVVDGERRYGNGLLIPAGPLREPPRPVDLRVVNGGEAHGGEYQMRLRLGSPIAIASGEPRSLDSLAGMTVDAIAGIGNPGRFFEALRHIGISVREHGFADHHRYCAEDFAGFTGPLLMTEKDAVKCRQLGLSDAWAVPVRAELPVDFFPDLDALLDRFPHARPVP
jgi:tetraacyldisaccharide 4'-kinase